MMIKEKSFFTSFNKQFCIDNTIEGKFDLSGNFRMLRYHSQNPFANFAQP